MERFLLMGAFALLAGCATTPAVERVVDNRSEYPSMWLDPKNCGVHSTDPEARAMLASIAALSSNSYLSMEQESSCRTSVHEPGTCADYLPASEWKIVGGNGEDSPSGLAYRIYERSASEGKAAALVFAFRGTQPLSRDWISNLYLKTSIPPPQHREADVAIGAWIAENRPGWNLSTGEGMGGEELYAVGHSLGGAVAQYIAYTYPRATAIVFNPSPRTGYGSIAAEDYRNPPVCRMRESYEAVYTLVGGRIPLVKPSLHNCGFINQKKLNWRFFRSLVTAHGMRTLADSLACYAPDVPSATCATVVAEKDKAMPGVPCH